MKKQEKQNKEIEDFISWLEHVWNAKENEKMLIMVEISKNKEMFIYLDRIKNYTKEEQEKEIERLRGIND